MKKRTIRRAMALSVAMAALLALPMIAFAQASRNTHGGMFGTNSAQTENKGLMKSNGIVRSGTDENPFGNQAFGATDGGVNFEAFDEPYHEAPVGAGIAILLGAGLGYAAFKRRKNAKAKSTMLLAMAGMLLLGLAQCKKDGPEREMVEITLKFTADGQKGEASPNGFLGFVDIKEVDSLSVEGEKADDGQKGDIDPDNGNTAPVIYSEGDTMYVGSRGKYMGYLICQSNGTFTGMIDATAEEGAPLQFIYLGGRDVTKSLSLGETASFNFSLANQWDNLPVVSCGVSREEYDPGTSTYTSYLRNQCALVKFSSSPDYYRHLTLSGVKNKLVINFNGTVETTEETGDVDTHGKGFNRYIVVPADQGVVSGTASGRGALGTFQINKAARPNGFIHGENVARVDLEPNPIQGEFTIDNAGTKVHFAPYNLTATTEDLGATWTWEFASWYEWDLDHRLTSFQDANQYINGNGTVSQNGTVNRFCWSTRSSYYGIHNSTDYYFAAGDAFRDWGNIDIENGGGYDWFTMSHNQWDYLLEHNVDGSTAIGGNGRKQIGVIRPDDDDWPIEGAYSAHGLALEEAAGSVVLYGERSRYGTGSVSTFSHYWTSTPFTDNGAYYMIFDDDGLGGNIGTEYEGYINRYLGRSVRLVKNILDPGGYPPTVITLDPYEIGHYNAKGGGEVTNTGGHPVTARGIRWSESPNMNSILGSLSGGEGIGSFNELVMSNLEPGTTYYVQAYATNVKATGYGEVKEFTTLCNEDCDAPHSFSIGPCHKVYISPGNLQYDPNSGWRFTSPEWDYVGSWRSGQTIDLFSYGVWNDDINTPYADYNGSFGTNQFTGTPDDYTWFTMSGEEWDYLMSRYVPADYPVMKRYLRGHGRVNGINGLIILPDDWDFTIDPSFDNMAFFTYNDDYLCPDDDDYDHNVYDETTSPTWSQMKAAGAVFLPANGVYYGGDPYQYHQGMNCPGSLYEIWNVGYSSDYLSGWGPKFTVRLVRDACQSTWDWKGGK